MYTKEEIHMNNQLCPKCDGLAKYDPINNRFCCEKCTSSWERPRTRYEAILHPSIRKVAEKNIDLTLRGFYTSDDEFFNNYNNALEHEIAWLNEPED